MFASWRSTFAGLAARLLHVRSFVRAPIWLFRARLGMVFGGRMLMLEHVGRSSGKRRYVVLEVIGNPTPATWLVVSGFGRRAQWFRNVETDPHVQLQLGSHAPVPAVGRELTPAEAAGALEHYAAARPRSWATLRPVLERTLDAEVAQAPPAVPVVAFDVVTPPRRSRRRHTPSRP